MKQTLLSHIASVADPKLRAVCDTITLCEEFDICPASLSFHHAYEGGLLAHTVEVCKYSLNICKLLVPVNTDVLITSALFHDFMKIKEYRFFWDEPNKVGGQRSLTVPGKDVAGLQKFWVKNENRVKMFGEHEHIIASASQFQHTALNYGVDRKTIDVVVHCILAHHGRKEWGSPVEPQTLEALILSQADMLSAKFGATKDAAP